MQLSTKKKSAIYFFESVSEAWGEYLKKEGKNKDAVLVAVGSFHTVEEVDLLFF